MNIRHIRLILKREYWQRVKSPGFVIGTIVGVLGIAGLAFLPSLLNLLEQQNAVKLAVVDPGNIVFPYLPEDTGPTPTPVPGNAPQSTLPTATGIKFSKADTEDESVLSERVTKGLIDAYVVVQGTGASNATFTYHGKDRPGTTLATNLQSIFTKAAVQARLKESGITPQQAEALFAPVEVKVASIAQGTLKDEKSYFQSQALVYVLLLLLYMTMLMYGVMVAMGVVEEKSTRVMEVLITSVRPIELMIGKVLGVGLVGLTQYGAWVVIGLLGLTLSGSLAKATAGLDVASVPIGTLIFFLVFFVLGYLLYACIYAALGSLVSRSEEVNSVTTPITIVTVATYLLSFYALGNPEADFVKWISFVPFFTPMLMFIRVALSSPAWWELVLAILLLLGTSLFFAWVAAKIYRIGVLMYGKRPSFREVGRLLRTA